VIRTTFIASFFMVFVLACGQALAQNWQICATSGAAASFALILFNHRKNIINFRSKTAVKPVN
jgi:hypothetical protein